MNLRKAVVIFVITGFVLAIACSVAVYNNFQGRFSEWEQSAERGGDYGGEDRESDGERGRREKESGEDSGRGDRESDEDSGRGDRKSDGERGREDMESGEDRGKEDGKSDGERGREDMEVDGDHEKKDSEPDREYQSGSGSRENDGNFKDKERKEGDWEDILKTVRLSGWDVALKVGCGITGMVLGIWFWVLILIAVYRKARRMGVNMTLWMAAAVVFNLAALVVLYLYGMLKGTCEKCGRVRSKGGKFCGRCGSPLEKTCQQCGQAAKLSSLYCGSCGRKLDEEEKQ